MLYMQKRKQAQREAIHLDAKAVSPLRIVSLSFRPYAKKALILFCHDSANSIQGNHKLDAGGEAAS